MSQRSWRRTTIVGIIACVAVFAIGMAAGLPFGIRMIRQQRDYLMNTEYARAHFSDIAKADVSR